MVYSHLDQYFYPVLGLPYPTPLSCLHLMFYLTLAYHSVFFSAFPLLSLLFFFCEGEANIYIYTHNRNVKWN